MARYVASVSFIVQTLRSRLARLPWRPIPFALALATWAARGRGEGIDDAAKNRSVALCEALASQKQLLCDESDVSWLHGPDGVAGSMRSAGMALVRARLKDEPNDLYLVTARLSPEGVLLDLGRAHDITNTYGVDESVPVRVGHYAAYYAAAGGTVTSVHALDLDGKDPDTTEGMSSVQKKQIAITNLQLTGQSSGVVHQVFALDPVATKVTIEARADLKDGELFVRADGREIVIDAKDGSVPVGSGWVRATPDQRAKPPAFLAWGRTVGSEFLGDEQMFAAKAIAMTAIDWLGRVRSSTQDDQKRVDEELGDLGTPGVAPTFTDPEIGWPPTPLTPILSPALSGEGKWIELGNDPFITPANGLPTPFVTTFVRPDKERKDVRIYVTMWDPRQIALHMQAGTVEPISATGEAGPGQIPRVPEIVTKVVAGFNGGFQAQHGEYGMQADGVLYLPPKPYAATVLELRDGTTALGSWPASQEVPDEVLSYRQNLTAMVEKGKYNPWGRTWWGGTPPEWKDNIHTTRSGLCLTKENYVAYIWGADASSEAIAGAMFAARCTYGMHLDMNPGMAGFEFYDVQPSARYKPLGRPLQPDWEYEGTFKALPDIHYRARRMIRGMQEQNFPQYIHLDGRDFFYLTRRPLLPGADLVSSVQGEGVWTMKGLPQHGFPYAMATTHVHTSERADARLGVLRLDPRTLRPAGSAGTSETTPTVATFTNTTEPHANEEIIAWSHGVFVAGKPQESAAGDLQIARITKLDGPARAVACVEDEDGMLLWMELPANVTPDATLTRGMDLVLHTAGCSSRYAVVGDTRALLGGTLDLDAVPAPIPKGIASRLVRGDTPSAKPYFESTPIVSPNTWQPLQMQRVRYFPKAKKPDAGAPSPLPSATPTLTTPN